MTSVDSPLAADRREPALRAIAMPADANPSGDIFAATFGGFAEVQQKAKATVDALANYSTQKKAVIATINKSPVLSLEYTFTNQASTSLPTSSTQNVSVTDTHAYFWDVTSATPTLCDERE